MHDQDELPLNEVYAFTGNTFKSAMLCHAAECPAQVRVPLDLPGSGGVAVRVQEGCLARPPQFHGCGRPVIGRHWRNRETLLRQLNGGLQNLQREREVRVSLAKPLPFQRERQVTPLELCLHIFIVVGISFTPVYLDV